MILAGAILLLQDARAAAPLNAAAWITHDDYPAAAIRSNEHGTVGYDLSVDPTGRVGRCAVIESSGSTVLDEATCRLITARARFRPAQDAKGRAIAAHFRSRIQWRLPEAARVGIADWHAVAVMKVAADGRVLSCKDESPGIVPEAIGKPCEDLRDVPVGMLNGIGGQGERVLTFETAMRFDGSPEPMLRYHQAGQIGSALTRFKFDVNEGGRMENCVPVPTGEEGWLGKVPGDCSEIGARFTPRVGAAGKQARRSGVMIIAVSRRP